jgi:hypothetical protein
MASGGRAMRNVESGTPIMEDAEMMLVQLKCEGVERLPCVSRLPCVVDGKEKVAAFWPLF